MEFPYDGLEKVIISIASFKQVLSEVSLKEFGNLGKLIQKGTYFEPVYEAPTLPENITSTMQNALTLWWVVVPENMGKIPSQVEFLAQSESTWSVDTISSCPLSTKMSFMQKLGLRYKLFPKNEMMEDSIPGYQWSELNEKHPEQRKNYFEYFENHLKDAMKVGQQKKDFLVDVSQMKNLLSCNDKSSLPFELKGTTDLIIVQNVGYHIKDFAGLQFVIEVKKNCLSEKDQWQLLLQIFSVYSKSLTPCAPMGLLTNLNDYWYFLWVTQEKVVAQMLFGSPANGLQAIKEVLGQRNRSTLDAHIPLTISFLEAPTTITCKKLCNVSNEQNNDGAGM